MDIPTPVPGMVIRYAYLWADEHDAGREEGAKDRPVAIVLATTNAAGPLLAVTLPVTKRRLGLDDDRSWIVLTEANMCRWPGSDVRAVPGVQPATIACGLLPAGFFRAVRDRFTANIQARQMRQVPRTE